MTTKTVSIRAFRENMTKFLKEAQEKNVHFVIMRHSEPVAHVTPVTNGDSLESLAKEVAEARKAIKAGKVYSPEEVLDMIKQ